MSEDHKYTLNLLLEKERAKDGEGLDAAKFFEFFSAQQVLKSRGFDVDIEQLKAGNVGGSDDGGVDGIYCFVNHVLIAEDTEPDAVKGIRPVIELIVIQSTQHAGFTEAHIQKLSNFTKRCLRLTSNHSAYTSLYSAQLLEMSDKFRRFYQETLTKHPTVSLRFFVATLGDQVDPKVEQQANEFTAECHEYFHGASAEVTFFGADKLLTWSKREIEKTLKLPLANSLLWKENGVGYVGLVRLPAFYDFISDNSDNKVLREHLFESNVRDFQGHSIEVNEGIRRSLEVKEVDEFWWLNNGVTILATDVQGDSQMLALTDPLIVNGLQTSFVIHDYFAHGSGTVDDKRTILVRVIEADDSKVVDSIISANNNQTPIPKSYLRASDDIQRNIETVFRMNDLFYDRRKNFYRRQGHPVSKIVTPASLAQAIAAVVLHRPDDARGRATTIFTRDYKKLFSTTHSMPLYVVCAKLMKRIDAFLTSKSIGVGDRNNVKWYIALHVTAVLNKSRFPQRTKLAKLDVSVIPDAAFEDAFNFVWATYKDLGGTDKAAKGPVILQVMKAKLEMLFPEKSPKKTTNESTTQEPRLGGL